KRQSATTPRRQDSWWQPSHVRPRVHAPRVLTDRASSERVMSPASRAAHAHGLRRQHPHNGVLASWRPWRFSLSIYGKQNARSATTPRRQDSWWQPSHVRPRVHAARVLTDRASSERVMSPASRAAHAHGLRRQHPHNGVLASWRPWRFSLSIYGKQNARSATT